MADNCLIEDVNGGKPVRKRRDLAGPAARRREKISEIDLAIADLQAICNSTDDDTVTAIALHAADTLAALASQLPQTLHQRKCWGCGTVAYHADNRTPYVLCRVCGSQDTRLVREPVPE
jgi:rRNA maturation endonuclease Nob1